MREVARGNATTCENLQIAEYKSLVQWAEWISYWFALCNLHADFLSVYYLVQPHAQSFFLFPIVFVLIWFPFFGGKNDGAEVHPMVCFRFCDHRSRHLQREAERKGRKFWPWIFTKRVNRAPISVQQWLRNEECEFLARKTVNSSPISARQWWR